jgi:flagellar hook protein FlgE
LNSEGFPVIAPNFSGTPGLQNAYKQGDFDRPNVDAAGRLIAFDFGLSSSTRQWKFDGVTPTGAGGELVAASDIGKDSRNTNGLDGFAREGAISSKCRDTSFLELPGKSQDGYTSGDLQGYSVNDAGILSGRYTNGQTLQLYQIVLYDFPSEQNLRREGSNLYSSTLESGVPSSGAPGTGSFGATKGYSLEQSNADISREFVNMITTQRGFQANSKTITTVDTMLETIINMKR